MKRLACTLACVLLGVAPAIAQNAANADPISGTWKGDVGPTEMQRFAVTFQLRLDGRSITGSVTGPSTADLKTASFDPATGDLRFEIEVDGGLMVLEGTAVGGTATGRVAGDGKRGTFRLVRADGNADAAQPNGNETALLLRGGWAEVSAWIIKAADLVPAERYGFRPIDSVRTFGQLVGHVADGANWYCAAAAGRGDPWSDRIEKGETDKATLMRRLKESFDACDAVYAAGGRAQPSMANLSHASLHYGNMITYLRLLGLTPPSS